MSLTNAQLITLKAAILADPVMNAYPNDPNGALALAQYLNDVAVPPYIVWRSSVSLTDITSNGFTWTLVDSLSVGTARIWEWMFGNESSSINPSKANIRQGIIDVWSGTAGKLAVQASVFGHCKRDVRRGEKIFATGLGTDASPSTLGYEGTLSYVDVQDARNF